MLEIIALLCLIGAVILLIVLSVIDLRIGLLPNELVLGLACLGFVFHLASVFHYATPEDIALGGFIGGASLYLIRGISNWVYKDDTLGLGDVKLLGAAGIWLGPYFILIALSAGALAGIVHGLGYAWLWKRATGSWPNMNNLSLPAGPGFAVGIVVAGIVMYCDLPLEFLR